MVNISNEKVDAIVIYVFPIVFYSPDTGVMELTAKAVGRLALASGTFTAEYVEDLVKRSFEWIQGDRNEGKRHAAVSAVMIMNCFCEVSDFLLVKMSCREKNASVT